MADKVLNSGQCCLLFLFVCFSRSNGLIWKCGLSIWFIFVLQSVSSLFIACLTYDWCFTGACVCYSNQHLKSRLWYCSLCVTESSHSDMVAAWSGQLIYDFVIFLLTLVRSLRIRKQPTHSITTLLLRDGVSVHLTFSLQLMSVND